MASGHWTAENAACVVANAVLHSSGTTGRPKGVRRAIRAPYWAGRSRRV